MAGRGGERNTLDPSDVAMDQITNAIANLQVEKDRSYRNRTAHLQVNEKKQVYEEIVGGFIQGYEFSFENGDKLSHGSLISECRSVTDLTHHEATFLLLPKGERGRLAAERMFQSTDKMRGSDAIATAYLVAECRKLDKWIICYEKLACLLDDNSESVEPFYVSLNEISPYWKAQLRAIIRTLSDMGIRERYHGGMSDSTNYAVKSGSLDIKLIGLNKKKVDKDWNFIYDLDEFDTFFKNTKYINAARSHDWRGFSFLIHSHAMCDRLNWAELVLNHPLLIDPNMKIWSYTDLYEWTELIKYSDKVKFCNALYCLMPQYHKCSLWDLIKHCPDCRQLYGGDSYDRKGGMIYMDIIKFVRNMIHHGSQVFNGIWTYEDLFKKINGLFPGFMSLAYSVSKIKDEDRDFLYKQRAEGLPYR